MVSLFISRSYFGVWTDHSWLFRLEFSSFDSSCSLTIFELLFSVLRHPKTSLYPLLFGNLTHHAKLFFLQIRDHFCIGLLFRSKLCQPLHRLGGTSLCNTHLNFIELLNLAYHYVLLVTSIAYLLFSPLYFVKLFLPHQLFALLNHVLRNAVFAK